VGLAVVAVALVHPAQTAYAYPTQPAPLDWRPDGRVHALASYGDTLYVAGEFTGGIAAVDATTGQLMWTAMADSAALSIAVSADGSRVMAGGNFLSVNGEDRRRLVALNAADGSVVQGWNPVASGKVLAMAVSGDTLYVGGQFSSVSGSGLRGLAAIDVDTGQRIDTFAHSVGPFSAVQDMAIGAGRLLASGDFTTVDGEPRASIASFDLASHALDDWAPARLCSDCPNYWSVTTDGVRAYVGSSGSGGRFGAFDLTTGAQPWPLVQTDGDVQAVTMGFDGYVYIGGHFQVRVGPDRLPRTQLASVEAATGEVGPFAPGMCRHYPGVLAMLATPTRLYVGGSHSGVQVNGVCNDDRFLAIFAEPTPPPTTSPPTTTAPTTTAPTTTAPTTTAPTTTVPTTTAPTTTAPTTTAPTTTAPTTTTPAPLTAVTATVSRNLVKWPQGVRVVGRVTQNGSSLSGASVGLWAARAGSPPQLIATFTSSANGTVAFTHRPTARTSYQWRLSGNVQSTPEVVRVQPSLTATVSQHRLAAGAKASISGVTTPSRVGTPVKLQKWTGQRWAVVQTTIARHTATATKASRAYAFVVSPRTSGVLRYRVVVPADDGRVKAVSPERRIRVFDATIAHVRTSPDEHVVVKNTGQLWVRLKGWSLTNGGGTTAVLPTKFVRPGKVLRIHSGRGRNDVNDLYLRGPDRYGDHDRVVLRDWAGFRVATYRY
jgi:hypothetical protein